MILFKITTFKKDGQEYVLWEGKDPSPQQPQVSVSRIPISPNQPIDRIRVYLDSKNVAGWNEIDAVGLEVSAKQTVWAEKGEASSSFGGVQRIGWSPFSLR